MKSLFVLMALVIALGVAQRPGYLGSGPVGYPGLASRFKDENAPTQTVANRINVDANQKIPVDARGDVELVNRLNQWPREHRPFWILNADHIEAQRGGPGGFDVNQSFGGSQVIASNPEFQQRPRQQLRGGFDFDGFTG